MPSGLLRGKLRPREGVVAVVQLLSCVRLFVTRWTEAHSAPLSSAISQSLLKFMSIESGMPSNYLILVHPLLLLPSIFPCIRVFSNTGASASASVLLINIQGWFPLGWLVWSLCCPRDSQESSPTPQLESISSLALSLLYGKVSEEQN